MNKPQNAECARTRGRMMEWTLEGRLRIGLPEALKTHLDRCPSCALYAEWLEALPRATMGDSLYTPALRARTLSRLSDRPQRSLVLWLVPPALALNLFLSMALPAGLFHEILPAALSRTLLGGVLSVLAAAFVGTATVLVCSLSMKLNALKEVHHA